MATIRCGEYLFEDISAVLFDKDGTLAYVEDYLCELGHERICQIAAALPDIANSITANLTAAMGISAEGINPAGLMAIASRHENEIAAAAYVANTGIGWMESKAIVKAAFDRAKANMPTQADRTPLILEGRSLIAQLKTAGVKVGIISADSHTAVSEFIDYYNLSSKIDWYCGSSKATIDKTAPNALSYACKALGRQPTQTLVIGDSMADWVLAQQGAAGFIATTGGWRQELTIPEARITVAQLSQVECFD